MNRIEAILSTAGIVDSSPISLMESVEWPKRAQDFFIVNRIRSMKQLHNLHSCNVVSQRNIGVKTIRDIIAGCVQNGLCPRWFRELAPNMLLRPGLVPTDGWYRLSGPYFKQEKWMLELAIANLRGIPWEVIEESDGWWLYRHPVGIVETTPEENEITNNIPITDGNVANVVPDSQSNCGA